MNEWVAERMDGWITVKDPLLELFPQPAIGAPFHGVCPGGISISLWNLKRFDHHKSFLQTVFSSGLQSWSCKGTGISWKLFWSHLFLTKSQKDTQGTVLNYTRQILLLNRNKMNKKEKCMNNVYFRVNKDLLLTHMTYFAVRPQVSGYG